MGEPTEPVAGQNQAAGTISHRRLLIEMIVITLTAGVIGLIAGSARFFAGVLVGGAIAVVNFLWLDRSLTALFRSVANGVKPGLPAVRFILRYLVIGLLLLGIYLTDALPMTAMILGLASFALAVLTEGIISIFRNP
jgi:hypothetical protein